MKIATIGLVVGACLFVGDVEAADATAVDSSVYEDLSQTTFTPLFDALKGGDLASLKQLLEPNVYEQYRVLFEQNGQYDQFLRDYYANADFQLDDLAKVADGYLAQVTIYWPDGHSAVTNWHVHREPRQSDPRCVSPLD